MQKLDVKPKNVPADAPQVRCSTTCVLNREETLSAHGKLLASNNSDVDNSSVQEVLKTYVYVLSKSGSPLMPCTQAKARKLLRARRATVVRHKPFTIQIVFECENKVQDVVLGIDPGYENMGLSARTETKELFSANVQLRINVSKLLAERRMHRRNRRCRLWHRKPRFLNRKKTRGWLAPSIQHKLDSHIRLAKIVASLFPVSRIIVEVANFDIQKINNPDIEGVEYQQGNLYGYENTRAYLIAREQGKCQLCGKESIKGNPFKTHHIIKKCDGGTDKPDNLALLHYSCHKKLHREGLGYLLKKNKQFKAETFMSIIRWRIVEGLKTICNEVSITYGHITKLKRHELKLSKEHCTDAFMITEGSNQKRTSVISVLQKRGNNRCLQLNRQGFKPSIRRQRYPWQPKDKVKTKGIEYEVIATHSYGKWMNVVDKAGKRCCLSTKDIERHYYNNGLLFIAGESMQGLKLGISRLDI